MNNEQNEHEPSGTLPPGMDPDLLADLLALGPIVVECASQAICLPAAHAAEPGTEGGKKAAGTKQQPNHGGGSIDVRPAPPFDMKHLADQIGRAEKIHDMISAALTAAGVDPQDPHTNIVREIVLRRQRGAMHPDTQLPRDVEIAVATLPIFEEMINRRAAARSAATKPAPTTRARG